MEDLYKILQCNSSASQKELKKCYQELALRFHPDRSKEGQLSHEKFIKIHRAWEILGDPTLRQQFDVRWKERCLAQAFPIQDTVDFEDFEEPVREDAETENENTDIDNQFCVHYPASAETQITDDQKLENVEEIGRNFTKESISAPGIQDMQTKGENSQSCVSEDNKSYATRDTGPTDLQYTMQTREEKKIYTYTCRCGGQYVLTGVDVKLKFDIVCCDTCSLSVKVIYPNDEEER